MKSTVPALVLIGRDRALGRLGLELEVLDESEEPVDDLIQPLPADHDQFFVPLDDPAVQVVGDPGCRRVGEHGLDDVVDERPDVGFDLAVGCRGGGDLLDAASRPSLRKVACQCWEKSTAYWAAIFAAQGASHGLDVAAPMTWVTDR